MNNPIPLWVLALVVATVIGLLLMRERARKSDPLRDALNRLRNDDNAGAILTREQMLFLAQVMEVSRHMEELDALRAARRVDPQDIRSILNDISNMLIPNRQQSDTSTSDEGRQGGVDELAWNGIRNYFPRNNRRYFVHIFPSSDPRDWTAGIAGTPSPDPDRPPTPTPDPDPTPTPAQPPRREGTYPDGRRWEEEDSVGEDGSTTTVSREYDRNGRLTATWTHTIRPDGTATSRWEVYGNSMSSRVERDFDAQGNVVRQREYWRDGNAGPWRPGRPLRDLERYPTDEASSRGRTYFIRLFGGGYAKCEIVNPISGIGRCTVLGSDLVNIRSGYEPLIHGESLIINPYDLVVNPPSELSSGSRTPTRIPGQVGPGPRPPDSPT